MKTIEFHDKGPDDEDCRRFTLTWPIEPRKIIVQGKELTQISQSQCFFSTQWRTFLAQGFVQVNDVRFHEVRVVESNTSETES